MPMTRRDLLAAACSGTASLITPVSVPATDIPPKSVGGPVESAYRYRIAFGAWINDMRRRPLPLENWPAPQFDDETVEMRDPGDGCPGGGRFQLP